MRSTFYGASALLIAGTIGLTSLSSCGGDKKNAGSCSLDPNKHYNAEKLEALNVQLTGDTVQCDASYDLYFDFSSTMKKSLKDQKFKELIESAVYKGGAEANCYSIGENSSLTPIAGDLDARKNEILSEAKYTQALTFMTPNLDNIAGNLKRPAFMFTDFSVDEGKETTSMSDGVKSTYVRGPQYKGQLLAWLNSGGSIRIYGKQLSDGGAKSPIYVIAFLPAGFKNDHKAQGIVDLLERDLKKDLYLNYHPNFAAVTGGNNEQLSDSLGWTMRNKSQKFTNGKGELHMYDGAKLLENVKTKGKEAEASLYHGISYTTDSTSYLKNPVFVNAVNEYQCDGKDALKNTFASKSINFFGDLQQNTSTGSLSLPLNNAVANKDASYNAHHFFRNEIILKSGELNFDDDRASQLLQYDLKAGGKIIKNNCLYQSLKEALSQAVTDFKPRTVYTVNAFVKDSTK